MLHTGENHAAAPFPPLSSTILTRSENRSLFNG